MARFDRMTVLHSILEGGLAPVFYNNDVEIGKKIVAACVEGGARIVEFTNRGDRAWNVFTELIAWVDESQLDVILGVGSVCDAPTASLYIGSGANFVVGPLLNPEVARLCNRRKIAYSPGCGSVSEISQAEELGVEIVKVFPGGQVGGPAFVKAVLGPMPWTRIMPTGGVDATQQSVGEWIQAGAACLGMGSKLIRKDLVLSGDYVSIRANVSNVLKWIRESREKRGS
ncbi:MAG: bifunctional 4-hydroxy-2-oxoglutarate aldolase/2-dehydro-3-deoxy-phosphogluconate aldolase [Vicinamibacteria bacterium]|nr:bifunctional 4-hydroxy-2-oxoglutarate aldolase/2-dehydro-3-deoxy-phosphogluconate aldolase [Vicinamibacteria bacterium]